MKKLYLVVVFMMMVLPGHTQPSVGTFVAGDKTFLLNGKPFVIRAGELHFPRIPREYWEHRIQMCKAMGMNTICIYLFWNYHEEQPGQFDFTGPKDVAAFVKLVQANGMYCIVRPGPYACAEWDMGGLPWWLLKKKDIQIRSAEDPYFLERSRLYLNEVGKHLAPLQLQNGGNILMVQVENEYATYGSDVKYMEAIRDMGRGSGFDKVQLFRCDWSSNFNKYKLNGVATTLNFGAGSNVDNQFKLLRELDPSTPLMCSEYWTGWFDHWGRPHETRSVASFIGSLKDMLDRKISFSLYMAHGGTSFGQWGGANAPPYSAMVSSYDYNAPIDEQGSPTEKFFAVRDLLKNYLQEGETLPDPPAAKNIISLPAFQLNEVAPLFQNLPAPKTSKDIQPMEMFDQGWGRILYRTHISPSPVKRKLLISDVADWALVFVDGKQVGRIDRRMGGNSVELPAMSKRAQLDILVEATGRVNYGKAIVDRKGITKQVLLLKAKDSLRVKDWKVYNFPVHYAFQAKAKFSASGSAKGPAWYKGKFTVSNTGDTWLDMSTWGKGMVWVNGYNIGRFWKIGPQQALFMPGCWLKKGSNEIIVLDLETPTARTIKGLDHPVIDLIRPDASLLNRKAGQLLDLAGETPVKTGRFDALGGWQAISFDKPVTGRYFCLEALSSQRTNDSCTSVAELEVIGENGEPLPRQKWTVIYADSEEITAANNAADKIFDQQESTFWQTESAARNPGHPHQVVIDMGEELKLKGFRYLPRSDRNPRGLIRDYRIFISKQVFRL
jgi:beta-galactosidase